MNIKNIIFDLGMVVLNIDFNAAHIAFEKSGLGNFNELYAKANQIHLFDMLEVGSISPKLFQISSAIQTTLLMTLRLI